jgi:hypothetical protein
MAKTNYPEEQVAEWYALLEGDLQTLFRLIVRHGQPLDEGSIRAASPILRRWLVEGLLGKLGRGLERKPTIPALNNEVVIRALPQDGVTCFITGGVRFNGKPVSGIYISDKPYLGRPPIPVDMMKFEMVRLGVFIDQKRLYFRGHFFSCAEIIKFVANKLGGVHHDYERDERQRVMEAAADAITFGGPEAKHERGKLGQTHLVVEPEAIEPLNGLHVEVIAAAASLMCIQFDGKPVLDLTIEKSATSRISDFLGLRDTAFRKSVSLIERSKERDHE